MKPDDGLTPEQRRWLERIAAANWRAVRADGWCDGLACGLVAGAFLGWLICRLLYVFGMWKGG